MNIIYKFLIATFLLSSASNANINNIISGLSPQTVKKAQSLPATDLKKLESYFNKSQSTNTFK